MGSAALDSSYSISPFSHLITLVCYVLFILYKDIWSYILQLFLFIYISSLYNAMFPCTITIRATIEIVVLIVQ